MQEVEITWGRAIKVWWSLTWRIMLIGWALGFVSLFIADLMSVSQDWVGSISLIISTPAVWWIVKKVLVIHYSDFRLALLPNEPDAQVSPDNPS